MNDAPPMTLAQWQSALVDVVVLGADTATLPGADASRLEATRGQLIGKHSGIVRQRWPELAAALGEAWGEQYRAWGDGDGWHGPTVAGILFATQLLTQPGLGYDVHAAARSIVADWEVRGGEARQRPWWRRPSHVL